MAQISSDVFQAIGYAEGQSFESVAAANAAYDAAHPVEDYLPDAPATQLSQPTVTQGPSESMTIQMMAEVAAWVSPTLTVDPYASLGGAIAAVPTAPTGIGLSPGLAGLAPAPSLPTVTHTSPMPTVTGVFPGRSFPAILDWATGAYPLGNVVFEKIANRQAGGVRFGTLPMVVFQDNSGKGPGF